MKRAFPPISVLVLLAILFAAQAVDAQKKRASKPTAPKSKVTKPSSKPTVKAPAPSTVEEALLAEINLARSNPPQYASYLETFKQNYNGKELKLADGKSLVTIEGVGACDEAIAYLRTLKPMAPLQMRAGLGLGAKDHVGDLIRNGARGHKGSDGSLPEARVSRYGTWSESVGENIIYQSTKTREDVISLIIDDGVANRGHRKNIFKPTFNVVGIALSSGASGTVGVITFAGGFADRTTTGNTKSGAPAAARF